LSDIGKESTDKVEYLLTCMPGYWDIQKESCAVLCLLVADTSVSRGVLHSARGSNVEVHAPLPDEVRRLETHGVPTQSCDDLVRHIYDNVSE
jgi:hypothetical protein